MTTAMKSKPVSRRTSDRRLLKLAAFLRTLPRKRFDYTVFVGFDWDGKPDLSCGTTACALGWATVMPEFRRLGLRLVRRGSPFESRGKVILGTHRVADFDAAVKLFGIPHHEALHLFAPKDGEYGATPKQVARKIEQFVAGRGRQDV